MLTVEQLQQIRTAQQQPNTGLMNEALSALNHPTDEQIINSAAELMTREDRNLRVLALRVLAHYPSDKTTWSVLNGLRDPERRVRDVAVQSSVNLVHHPNIAQRLGQMATDTAEKRKISERALSTLLGIGAPIRRGPLPGAAISVLEPLLSQDPYQARILHGLVQIDLCDEVERLLRQFTAEGTAEESAMATKALSGYRMVNIGHFEEGPERQRILDECELASGRVYYWVLQKLD